MVRPLTEKHYYLNFAETKPSATQPLRGTRPLHEKRAPHTLCHKPYDH